MINMVSPRQTMRPKENKNQHKGKKSKNMREEENGEKN
jgi:hypothetical protein